MCMDTVLHEPYCHYDEVWGLIHVLMKLLPPMYKPYHVPSLHHYNNQKILKPHIVNPIKLATGRAAIFYFLYMLPVYNQSYMCTLLHNILCFNTNP